MKCIEPVKITTNDEKENSSDDDNFPVDEEAMLINRNQQIAENVITRIAPGQGKCPVTWRYENIDELCFPKIFAGERFNTNNMSYTNRVKSESKRHDQRSRIPTRQLYLAKRKQEHDLAANINICLRKLTTKDGKPITVGNALDKTYINELLYQDDGYAFLKGIRGTPPYWQEHKKNMMAMLRQLGRPAFFVTLTAAEKNWPELVRTLYNFSNQNASNVKITVEEAMNLSDFEKSELISRDPVTCAEYFHRKASKFFSLIQKNNSVFGEHTVEDYRSRVEFQMRGSPHEHMLLWLKDAPIYNGLPNRTSDCISFIDNFITCEYDENNPFVRYQFHRHSPAYCLHNKKCRFGIPHPVMPETMILEPLPEGSEKECAIGLENFKKIDSLMQSFFKKPTEMTFTEVLKKLEMDSKTYYQAIRSTLKRPTVFLRRSSREVGINAYNTEILNLFEANMDIQFVLDEFAVASYIINYINKSDAGLTK